MLEANEVSGYEIGVYKRLSDDLLINFKRIKKQISLSHNKYPILHYSKTNKINNLPIFRQDRIGN